MSFDQLGLKAHHVGCLTEDMERSISVYRSMGFSDISEIYSISSQQVKVCFIKTGENFYLELVEFKPDNPSLSRIFKSKNPYYHVGYMTEKIAATMEELKNIGFYLVNQFSSEAFRGKTCAFMYSPEMQLIELIEI